MLRQGYSRFETEQEPATAADGFEEEELEEDSSTSDSATTSQPDPADQPPLPLLPLTPQEVRETRHARIFQFLALILLAVAVYWWLSADTGLFYAFFVPSLYLILAAYAVLDRIEFRREQARPRPPALWQTAVLATQEEYW
eukprot:TRINITY_DN19494_c0_g1_i1.p1 TRINITY_DN19494_c0_g1~~TRINITY_DN19494_c0_g1_i1.p1  ORF type:complete len:141 (-),score=27.00 TRINITY_DN19494_c0_g1_i1:47-469(-)